jgi:hypothetical protein
MDGEVDLRIVIPLKICSLGVLIHISVKPLGHQWMHTFQRIRTPCKKQSQGQSRGLSHLVCFNTQTAIRKKPD